MKLFFKQLGSDHSPAMIVLHGLFGASDNWLTLSREWAKTHRIFLLDLRNHGRSPHDADHNYRVMAEDVNEFMHDLEIPSAILLGHSMGGKVAMTLALKYPQKIEKLIVVDIAPKAYKKLEFTQVVKILRSLNLSEIKTRKDAEERLANDITDQGLRRFLLKNLTRTRDKSYTWRVNLDAIYQNIDVISGGVPADGKYEKPTLFIRGENSLYIREADVKSIKAMFPKTILLTVKSAGHWVHADKPEVVLNAVIKFISS